ncbi:hypothetical protein [Variovorax sp. PBL-E5]|uniref:hypothetical protein n=1 Tax=Variovorax sp. PBL-E5 TaxID=434014 RepID=UPI0013194723|nr:hypothetical protein [Variovorax sp. PBL-E5]VTU40222.1 hypothetical protein E5CHR_05408 [Variovorax sp. PBL-E5]
MTLAMTPSELAADALVRAYLDGRTMMPILHGAVVSVVAARLDSGKLPMLDEILRADIDHQASASRSEFALGMTVAGAEASRAI